MASRRLAEITVKLIEAHIKANIATALAEVRTDRADAAVTTEVPKSYFKYELAEGYRAPAVFTICDSIQSRNVEKQANFLACMATVRVSVIVEDRLKDSLVVKSWRYQAALHKLLHLVDLISADSKVKIVSKVEEILFSPEFTDTKDPSAPQSVFRKEVLLLLNVEHYENL
jgi:hypothetical protein